MASVTLPTNIKSDKDVFGYHEVRIGLVTLASYLTGGLSLTPAKLGLGSVDFIAFEPASDDTPDILHLKYDYTNSKVLSFDPAGTETANATDLSGYTARFIAIGK